MSESAGVVFVVDDDASVRRALLRLFRSAGIAAEGFASADEFLTQAHPAGPCCLVLDVRMPGVTGPDLQQRLKDAGTRIPIVFLTGHGDVPLTARVMKAGAVDVLTKPVQDRTLLEAVQAALEQDRANRAEGAALGSLQSRLRRLTPREGEVLRLVIAGLLNKQIAAELGTSERTVKVHRGRVMHKMEAGSVADLVRAAGSLGIAPHVPQARPIPGWHHQASAAGNRS
ncbi:MAG TPA: response regulator transcription factor [Gemmatimonadales bacterium]|nr:response regulator transcription factor [Gemmatimonadales bacterium]